MNTSDGQGPPMDTIGRAAAEADADSTVTLYRADGEVLRYDELYERVDAEGSALPADQWRDGYWDASQYIVEACEVGIYDSVDVQATMVTRYSNDKSVWTYAQMRDEVFPAEIEGVDMEQFIGGELTFEDWLAESLNVGIYSKVHVMEYRDEWEDELVDERLVVED